VKLNYDNEVNDDCWLAMHCVAVVQATRDAETCLVASISSSDVAVWRRWDKDGGRWRLTVLRHLKNILVLWRQHLHTITTTFIRCMQFPRSPLRRRICTLNVVQMNEKGVGLVDVITCDKFFCNHFRGLWLR